MAISWPRFNLFGVRARPVSSATALEKLPTELLLSIVDFLPLNNAASLALGSHALLQKLGKRYFHALRRNAEHNEQRALFLQSLSRDHARFFFCAFCSTFHSSKRVSTFAPFQRPWPRCVTCDSAYNHMLGIPVYGDNESMYQLSFLHIQLGMKRYRCGPEHGRDVEELFHLEVFAPEGDPKSKKTISLSSVEYRIVSNELFIRRQHVLVVPSRHRDDIFTDKVESSTCARPCRHLSMTINPFRQNLESLLFEHLAREEGHSEFASSFDIHCDQCGTEIHTEVSNWLSSGLALVITTWLNLGSGLTVHDPRWRKLVEFEDRYVAIPEVEPGSVQLAFERSLPLLLAQPREQVFVTLLPVQSLTRRNLSFLKNEIYTRDLRPMAKDPRFRRVWVDKTVLQSTWLLTNYHHRSMFSLN